MIFRRLGGAFTLLCLGFFTLSATVLAAPFNITTSPLPVLLNTKPGTTVTTKLRVENSSSESTRFKVSLKKFKANGDSGNPQILDKQSGDTFFDWVSFDRTSFVADPNVWNEVTMTIKVPPEAAFGYYYAVTFSQEAPDAKPTGTASQVRGAGAILVLLDVQAKGEKKQISISSFTADKKLYEYLPTNLNLTVHNGGNIHLAPVGNIFITRGGTKPISTLQINSASGNVLPGTNRTFTASWSDGFPVYETKRDNGQIVNDASGKPAQQLKWDFSKVNHLRIGKYTAHLLVIYNDGQRDVPLEATVSFWVVPWKILPVIALALVLIGIGLWTSIKPVITRIKTRWL
jgi:hypothetical protein